MKENSLVKVVLFFVSFVEFFQPFTALPRLMGKILVPLGMFVVLPVMIVWLVGRTRQNETNRKTEILLKAMESGATIDTNIFKTKTIKERLLKRLTTGCIFTLMGVFFAIISIVNWVNLQPDMSNDSAVVPAVFGGIWLVIGISFFIVFFVGKTMKHIQKEKCANLLIFKKFLRISIKSTIAVQRIYYNINYKYISYFY